MEHFFRSTAHFLHQPRPCGEGHHGSQASGVSGTGWQSRHLLPWSLRPGCPSDAAGQGAGYSWAPGGSLFLWVFYSGKFSDCSDDSWIVLIRPSCFRCAWHLIAIAGSFFSKVSPKLVSPLQPSQHVEPSASPACPGCVDCPGSANQGTRKLPARSSATP